MSDDIRPEFDETLSRLSKDHAGLWDALAKGEPFEPGAYYCPDGDCLHAYLAPDMAVSEWLGPRLSVHRSQATGEVVGCTVEGVRAMLAESEGRKGEPGIPLRDLEQYLKDHPCRGFRPSAQYVRGMDWVNCYFAEDFAHTERAGMDVDVSRSVATGAVVGIRILGVRFKVEGAVTR